MALIRNCILFREMLVAFTRRELRQRYVGSIIGWPWPFLQPLLMLGVYYFVFNNLMALRPGAGLESGFAELLGEDAKDADLSGFNVVLMCAGLLPWLMTSEFLVRSANIVLESGNLVKKVAFPAELIPISMLTSYAFNMVVIFAVFCGIIWGFTPYYSNWMLFFPVILFFHALFLLGLAYLFATINVFVRDVGQLLPLAINMWFFLTPIVYTKDLVVKNVPEMSWVFELNPLSYLVDLYRWCLFYPELARGELSWSGDILEFEPFGIEKIYSHLTIFGTISIVTFIIGYRVFMSQKMKFADEI